MKKLLITVCGRAGSKGFKNKNLKTFCGKPLVYYTLSAALLFLQRMPELQADICLNTDSELLAGIVHDKYPEVVYLPRGEALGGDTVPKMAVFQDSLARMEAEKGCRYDYLMDLDITSPLRTANDVACAYRIKDRRQDLDLVFSGTEARRNPYFNMAAAKDDHVVKVIESPFTARQQAPAIYDINASIYVFRRDFLADNTTGILWDGKVGLSLMKDTGILDIDSEEDFEMMEVIADYLYKHDPDFADVRNNIRE